MIFVPPLRDITCGIIYLKKIKMNIQILARKGVGKLKLYLDIIRLEKNMSIRTLAEKSGVAKSYIEKIEAGEANPTIDIMCKLAKALDVSVCRLFDCE